MISLGQALYEKYVEAAHDEAVGVDGWNDIGEKEQAIWQILAERLEEEFDHAHGL